MPHDDAPAAGNPKILRPARWSTASAPTPGVVQWAALSDVGRVRSRNEDSFFVGRFDRTLEAMLTSLPDAAHPTWHHQAGYVAIVADGMGGEKAGEFASQTAVALLIELVLETPDWIMRFDDLSLVEEVSQRMEARVQHVDRVLQTLGQRDPAMDRMGTTLTLVAVLPPDGIVAHVGDSRAYLRHQGTLTRLTRDHNMAQALADAGVLDASDVPFHPKRHLLLRAAGHGDGHLGVDVTRMTVEPGDQLLVCSDGLTEMISDAEIDRVLASGAPPATICRTLVDLALDRGGRDNITVIAGQLATGPAAR